ncbi:helicase-exonuclease AddAB subunit AddB [Clostridiaceae bacterium M8S5]|nr:helicase-exonuclease AddAB subunit AddB [Clostridiaceae bacterium M8S5]
MNLRYILGRAGSGKTTHIYKEILHKLKQDKKKRLILLVPEQFTLEAEIDLISKMGLEGIMMVEVLSFERLIYKVLGELGGLRNNEINELGKVMILRRLFESNKHNLKVYQRVSNQTGFLSSINDLIDEFKRNDIMPDELIQKQEGLGENNILTKKLHDVHLVYSQLQEYMSENYTDKEDRANLFIEKIEEAGIFSNTEIWLDGYNRFTRQQYRIIEKLVQKAEKVNISLTIDMNKDANDTDLFNTSYNTLTKLREIANNNNFKETKTDLEDISYRKSSTLNHLEKNFFAYPYAKYNHKLGDIDVYSLSSPYIEIEYVASKIMSLVRKRGYRFRDVAIVTGSMNEYGIIIKQVFKEYDIPYFIDEKRNITSNTIVKYIVSLLNIIDRNYRYDDVFSYVKTRLCDVEKDDYELLENYCLEYGIKGETWLNDFEFKDKNLSHINKIRAKIITPIDALKKSITSKNTVIDITKNLVDFFEAMALESKINSWVEELKDCGNLEYANETTQIWNIIMEVLQQVVDILGDTKIKLKEYIDLLETGFKEYKLGLIPTTLDQVIVGNVERSRTHPIKALFVVGVNDGVLPSPASISGLISDEEKEILKEKGMNIVSDSLTKAYEEKLLMYSAISKPSEYIWMSYVLADSEGKTTRPSIYISKLKSVFSSLVIKSDISDPKEVLINRQITSAKSTFKYMVQILRDYVDGKEISDSWWDVYNWYYNSETYKQKLNHMLEGLFYTNAHRQLGYDNAKRLYGIPLVSSISRFEKYINCPFSHFVKYGLRPQRRKEYKIDPPDMGKLFHDSLEVFSNDVTSRYKDWVSIDKEQSDIMVEDIVEDVTNNFGNKILFSSFKYKYLVKRLKRITKRSVWTMIEQLKQGEFIPKEFEFSFGESEGYKAPPILIELDNGDILKLEGRIDRLDVLEGDTQDYIKIIDYKSGSKDFTLSDVYYGLQLQLMVYLDAVLQNKHLFTDKDLMPGGIFYFRLHDPLINTEEMDSEVIEKEILKALKLKGLVLNDIKIIKAMDRDIELDQKSSILPVAVTKSGSVSKTSSVISKEELDALLEHVRNLIKDLGKNILVGNININPTKTSTQTACDFCEYKSICRFDIASNENKYNKIPKLSNKEVIEKLKREESEADA